MKNTSGKGRLPVTCGLPTGFSEKQSLDGSQENAYIRHSVCRYRRAPGSSTLSDYSRTRTVTYGSRAFAVSGPLHAGTYFRHLLSHRR